MEGRKFIDDIRRLRPAMRSETRIQSDMMADFKTPQQHSSRHETANYVRVWRNEGTPRQLFSLPVEVAAVIICINVNGDKTMEPQETRSREGTDRRAFLATAGKFAVVVPPAMTMLLSTTMNSPAIAQSAGAPSLRAFSAGSVRSSRSGPDSVGTGVRAYAQALITS